MSRFPKILETKKILIFSKFFQSIHNKTPEYNTETKCNTKNLIQRLKKKNEIIIFFCFIIFWNKLYYFLAWILLLQSKNMLKILKVSKKIFLNIFFCERSFYWDSQTFLSFPMKEYIFRFLFHNYSKWINYYILFILDLIV